jgi:2,4-dienoyl-CoA reductase-like NADH-dependent reductase (Old Yellow Enzyme family)
MSLLFSKLKIKDTIFRNRLSVPPMCQYSAEDGFANDWHIVHYGTRAVGGFALVIQEATAVSPEGRISPGDLGIYNDEHIETLQKITSVVKRNGALAGIQIAHAGRKGGCARPVDGGKQLPLNNGGWTTLAPSAISFNKEDVTPSSLDIQGIKKVISDFKTAASRALTAGYNVIEIHAAHGYLLHEFLSPLSNKRTDNYGGSFENRSRLLFEIVAQVQTVWPERNPLFVRISATDWVENGWDIDEAVKLCALLRKNGVDLIDTSSGGLVPDAKVPAGPGFQVPFAERIKKETGIMTGAVGLITSPSQAEEILTKGQADLILLGRASLRDPYFPLNAAKVLGEEITWPSQYLRAKI